jgi:hypothetical protein
MKFQLVLQFQATRMQDFDELVALEEELDGLLPPASQVDGHDFGVGEFNIFVLTDQPRETFSTAQALLQRRLPQRQLRAAYRKIDEDRFVILWPPDLEEFTVA